MSQGVNDVGAAVSRGELARSGMPPSRAIAQEMAQPLINLAGQQMPDGVRYSVSITRPEPNSLIRPRVFSEGLQPSTNP